MRLVDIDKLKEKIFAYRQQTFDRNFLEHMMSKKECPTISIQDTWPTAKWNPFLDKHGYPMGTYICSHCKRVSIWAEKYCPNCGYLNKTEV